MSLVGLLVHGWQFAAVPSALCALTAAVYLGAVRRTPRPWPAAHTLAFLAGLATIVVALDSGIGAEDGWRLSAHMLQHVLLLDLAPPLLLEGMPGRLLLGVLGRPYRRRVGRALMVVGHQLGPIRCLVIYTVVLLGTHVPVIFDAALVHPLLHDAQHVAYLLAGTILWWPLLGSPNPRRVGPVPRLLYLTAAMVPMTLFGAWLNRDPTLLYPLYAAPARSLGISALADQQQAGAIMWVLGTAVMGLLGLVTVVRSLLAAERRQQARERHELAGEVAG